MEHYLQLLFSKLKTTVIFIDAACKPTHKYLKDKAEQEAGHLRNRALIAVHFFVVLIFIIDLIQKKGAVLPNLIGIITCVIIVTFLLISCRYHPEVFNIFYNILIAVYGPHLTHTGGEEGLHTAWLSSFTFPTFVVLATGSLKHYVLHCLCQLFYINTFYQKVMEKHIEFATPQAFVRTLTYASNQAMVLNGLFVGAITCFLHNAYQRISIVEQKKEESERQKTFLLGFSHELRNLINSLMGNVKLATLENLSPRIKDLMLNAEVCGELLLHLINNILDTGKVEIGDLEINPTPIRLYDILERVWGVCSELIKRKDIRGKMKVSKNIPTWLKLDHYRLTQIFLNLVGNAIKFTDRGGSIDITVDWIEDTEQVSKKCFEPLPFNDENDQEEGIFEKSQALSVLNDSLHCLNFTHRKISRDFPSTSSKASKGILKLIVTDTGCGISKADIEKLFQKFTQVTNDVSKRNLGTGLGLFITKELCTRMKGEVKAYSKKGKGSSFICCIPVEPVEEKATSMDMESVKNLIMSKNLKSMIVDDVQFSHVILKDFFQKLGVQVMDVAENGLEAYQKFRDHKSKRNEIHIVTMDLYMPIMDGKEAARKIREYEVNNGIDPCLLIIVSGNCAESEISECVDANGKIRANAFLKKPASIDELLRVIANYILEWNIKHPTQTELTL